ncbi:MAG: DinB family protein [Thermomicrobiales bacterium]
MIDPQAELIEINRATPVVLRVLVHELDAGAARHAAEGAWAVIEVVAHLADAEERAVDRVQRMASEDVPEIFGYDQEELAAAGNYLQMDLGEQLDRFARLRGERVAILSALAPADWHRRARHSVYGLITIHDLMTHMAFHDAVHLAQVARLMDAREHKAETSVASGAKATSFDGISPEELERETDSAIAELHEHKRARSKPTTTDPH